MAQEMYIFVRSGKSASDYDGEGMRVELIEAIHHDPPHPGVSGVDEIITDKGTFYRYDCYWEKSPYGWERTNPSTCQRNKLLTKSCHG